MTELEQLDHGSMALFIQKLERPNHADAADTPGGDTMTPWDETPQSTQSEGVYTQARPIARVDERTVPVPSFLSREYFHYLSNFLADPSANPFFMREWRRATRFAGGWRGYLPLLAIAIAVGAGGLAIGALALLQPFMNTITWQYPLLVVWLLPAWAGSILFFFRIYGVTRDLSNAETLHQLYLTPMHPQEMVFGMIWGAALPYSLVVACLIPAAIIMGLHLTATASGGTFDGVAPLGLVLTMWPCALGAMLSSGSIAAAMSFGFGANRGPLARSLVVWLIFGGTIFLPLTLVAVLAFPLTFLVGGVVLVATRLVVAGGFLHHLAVRIAQESLDEGRQ